MIVIGAMTFALFSARFLFFRFYESPKFLVNKGREQDAIDVLHKIAKFNGAPRPTLTVDDFLQINRAIGIDPSEAFPVTDAKNIVMRTFKNLGFLRGLFIKKLECFTFILLALAYMVSHYFEGRILSTN